MKRISLYLSIIVMALVVLASCTRNEDAAPTTPITPYLIFKFKFDSTQERLNNVGQPSTIPVGNAAQSPAFNVMSAHYIELAPNMYTALGHGAVLYKAAETTLGGATAINFDSSVRAANGEVFFKIPIIHVQAGTYEWLRVSLAYQNYNVKYRFDTTIGTTPIHMVNTGTVASFIGFNTFIKSYNINTQPVAVNSNRKQGYWGFETTYNIPGFGNRTDTVTGQAPDGATTVVNPLASTSPIPAGSCVVTGAFPSSRKLVLTGSETQDIVVEVSLSTNKSFEWRDVIANGQWEPTKGEQVVDMGIRGMKPTVQ